MANWPIFDSTAEIGHNGAMSQRPPRADARRLALARLISMAGNMAAGIALAAVMWERTHSSAWVAAGALSTSLVAGIVTPITGALADRYDRRRVMIGSDLLAAVAFGLLAGLVAVDAPPATFLVAAAIGAVMESPFVPASRAALPNLVTDEDVPWANGLLGQVSGLSAAVGPLAGGALTGFLSGSVALGFNAVTFVASAWLVHSIRRSFSGDAAAAHASRRSMVREGFGVVRRTPLVRGVIVSGFVAFIGVGFVIAANPALADQEGAGPIGLGALWAGWGIGTIIGATLAPRFLQPERELAIVIIGFTLQGLALGAAAVLPFWFVVASQSLGGIGGGLADPARHTLIQRTVADHLRGRVIAVMEAAGWMSFAISLVAAGLLVDVIGLRESYALASALFLVGTLLLVALRGRATNVAQPERS